MISTKVTTAGELMAIALRAEREAIRRYSELATKMREAGNASAAALFERMVIEEQEHERLLLDWMEKESIPAHAEVGPIRWRDPRVATTYDDEARHTHYSTPYKALASAVNNEENAFRFYTHVAAQATDARLRKYAEILAREELAHAALFRAERRRAYHAERGTAAAQPAADASGIENETELLATAVQIDGYFLEAIGRLAIESAELTALAREVGQQLSDNKQALNRLAPDRPEPKAAEIRASLAPVDAKATSTEETPRSPETALRRLSIYCDQCFVLYDAIVESTGDESVLRRAQSLGSTALDRIGALQRLSEAG